MKVMSPLTLESVQSVTSSFIKINAVTEIDDMTVIYIETEHWPTFKELKIKDRQMFVEVNGKTWVRRTRINSLADLGVALSTLIMPVGMHNWTLKHEAKPKSEVPKVPKFFSEEHRQKLREAKLGKSRGSLSDDHKQKISESMRRTYASKGVQ